MEIDEIITRLEFEWTLEEGFFGLLRKGKFSTEGLARVLKLLDIIPPIEENESVNTRLVSLLWFIPTFMEWQKERLMENGVHIPTFEYQAITPIANLLEKILGMP